MPLILQSRRLRQAPASLLISSLILVAELVLLSIGGDLVLPLVQILAGLCLAGLLILGTRIGWALTLIASVWDAAARIGGEQPTWMLGLDGTLLVLLLLPSTLAWIWNGPVASSSGQPALAERFKVSASTLRTRASILSYRVIAWRLGIGLMVLLVVSGMVELWKEGDGRGSSVVSFIASVTDITFSVVLFAFIASLCAWAWSIGGPNARRGSK